MPGPTGRSQVSSPPSSIVARFAMSLPRPLRLLLLIVLPLLAVLIALVYSLTWRPRPHEEAAVSCSGQVAQLQPGQALKVMTWNVQYLAGKRYVFWYDLPGGDG